MFVSNVKIAWAESGAQNLKGHIYQVTGAAGLVGQGARGRLHFLSVRGHSTHGTDLTPSLPETSYNAALEAEFYATPHFTNQGTARVDHYSIVIMISR